MKTELIASFKLVTTTGRDMFIVTTQSGQTVWVPKAQFDTNQETISYNSRKAGEKYINKAGVEGLLKADRNDFVGASKQIVRKYSTLEIMDHLISKGVTPQFAVS